MIFEQWELDNICNLLQSNDDLKYYNIFIKLQNLMKTSKNKRYTLRTTDWLSEAAKKRNKNKKDNK